MSGIQERENPACERNLPPSGIPLGGGILESGTEKREIPPNSGILESGTRRREIRCLFSRRGGQYRVGERGPNLLQSVNHNQEVVQSKVLVLTIEDF